MELHFVEQGSSQTPLILLHAFPFSHNMWRNQVEGLSHVTRVIAVDLPGFGSTHPLDEDAVMASYATAITEFMDDQGINQAVFAGCSMGGYIMFELWRQASQRFAGAIFCDTRPEADTEATRKSRMESIDQIRYEGMESLVKNMKPKVLGDTSLNNKPELVEEVVATINENSPVGVIHALQAMAERPDSTSLLPEISVPSLVIVGEEDKVTPPSVMKPMADALPNCQYTEIPQAGHLSPLEQSQKVNEAINQFLEKLKT